MKPVSDLSPGELVRLTFGSEAALALYLMPAKDDGGVFGILSSSSFLQPMTWHDGDNDGFCLSYGLHWLIEEIHGPETACRLGYKAEKAMLHLAENGLVMSFRPPSGRYGYPFTYFNLTTLQDDRLTREAAPILDWKIWESPIAKNAGGEPLFEMNYPELNRA